MNHQCQIQKFQTLFQGNEQAYGQGDNGGGAIRKPVSLETFEHHLTGLEPIGVYPIRHFQAEHDATLVCQRVRWGCCDIDTGDWNETWYLVSALRGMGLQPHVERSRSKGWHVWVFVEEWVPAYMMRRALKVAYAAIDLPAKEANPKQETLRPEQLGNYVRLPYPGSLLVHKDRQVMLGGYDKHHDGVPFTLEEWLGRYNLFYTPVAVLEKWANKWYEPPKPTINVSTETVTLVHLERMNHRQRKFWENGPKGDRSAGLVALGHQLAQDGWQPQDVFAALWSCPWNKYTERVNGEEFVRDIVERVFTR